MSDQHKEWEDDGRTVADMSGLDRSPLFGHKEGVSRKKRQEPTATMCRPCPEGTDGRSCWVP